MVATILVKFKKQSKSFCRMNMLSQFIQYLVRHKIYEQIELKAFLQLTITVQAIQYM